MKIAFRLPINHPDSGLYNETIVDEFELIFGSDSQSLFHHGKHIDYYSGLTLEEAMKYSETKYDAYVYGLVNAMNGGRDLFLFVNEMRLRGDIELKGKNRAIVGFLTHEAGVHLANRVIERHLAKKHSVSLINDGWMFNEYEYDEETTATVGGELAEMLIDYFMERFN